MKTGRKTTHGNKSGLANKRHIKIVLSVIFLCVLTASVQIFSGWKSGFVSTSLACCYDPPEPAIIPDPVAPSLPSEAAAQTQTSNSSDIAGSAQPGSITEHEQDNENTHTLLPLYHQDVLKARNAIDDDQWLKAQLIVKIAMERFDFAPELEALDRQIKSHLWHNQELPFDSKPSVVQPAFPVRPLMDMPAQSIDQAQLDRLRQADYVEKMLQAIGIYNPMQ